MTTTSASDTRTAATEAVGLALKATLAAQRRMQGRENRCPGELSYAQYSLLFTLRRRRELSSTDLAHAADLSPASVTEMLDGLAAAGLVERSRSHEDRRVVLTSLTKHGAALVEKRRAQMEPRWRAALAQFSEEELLTAAAVLDQVRRVFDEIVEAEG
jgi:DNA-binding MarR family transcriptional regulator